MRLVEGDQALRDAAPRRHEALLLAEERALRVEDSLEVDEALAVLHVGDVEGAARGLHRFREDRDLRAELREADRGVFELAGRAQHRVLVLLEELLEAGVLHEHLIRQPAPVEDVPDEGGTEAPVERVRRTASTEDAERTTEPVERDGRIELRLAHADARRLRGHLQLGRAHVGPAAQAGRRASRR